MHATGIAFNVQALGQTPRMQNTIRFECLLLLYTGFNEII